MKRLYVWVFLTAVPLLAPLAHACSCMGGAECGAFQIHDTLFVGKALSVQMIETRVTGISFPVRRRTYRFEVSEALTGAPQVSEVIEIETGMGGGDCGYGFKIGQSYLVDASQDGENKRLRTNICSATQAEGMARNRLREIRAILAHQRLPDLSGTVSRQDPLFNNSSAGLLAGVTVHLTSVKGDVYTAVTDSDGIYSVFDLPAAEYRLDLNLPPNLVTYGDAMGHPQTIKIPEAGGAACHADAMVLPAGTISGQILDVMGKPVRGAGVVSLRKPGESRDEPLAAPTANGQFTIHFVTAGEYKVVYRIFGRGPVRETWLEPSSAFPQGAVVLKEGEHITGISIVAK